MSINKDLKNQFLDDEGWRVLPEIWEGLENSSEVMRLRKLHKYISSLAKSADPDLVPQQVWSNMKQCQNSFLNNKDSISHATNWMDQIMETFAPYIVASGNVVDALAEVFEEERRRAEEIVEQFTELVREVNDLKSELDQKVIDVEGKLSEVSSQAEAIMEYHIKVFNGVNGGESIESAIDNLKIETEEKVEAVRDFYDELFIDRDQEDE